MDKAQKHERLKASRVFSWLNGTDLNPSLCYFNSSTLFAIASASAPGPI